IGRSHEIKGEAVTAFVNLKERAKGTDELAQDISDKDVDEIGKIARPEEIIFSASLPKTSSAKIMRRLLRDIAEGNVLGDTSTLDDPVVVEDVKDKLAADE